MAFFFGFVKRHLEYYRNIADIYEWVIICNEY